MWGVRVSGFRGGFGVWGFVYRAQGSEIRARGLGLRVRAHGLGYEGLGLRA